jgi:hypothetical protein
LEPFYFEVKVGALLAFLHQFLKTAFRQTICVMDKIYVSELSDCSAVRSSGGFGGHYVTEVGSSSRAGEVVAGRGNLDYCLGDISECSVRQERFRNSSIEVQTFESDGNWLRPPVRVAAWQGFGGFGGCLPKTLRWPKLQRPKAAVHQLTNGPSPHHCG